MWTVTVSTPGSGSSSSRRPFASRYSLTPSIEATLAGSDCAAAAKAASRRSRAAAVRFKSAILPLRQRRRAVVHRRRGKLELFCRVHLLAHAIAALRSLLAFAGLARLLHFRLHLRRVFLATLRILRLRAHFVAHALAPLYALLAFAGLARLVARGLELRLALLAGFRVLGLRAVDARLARRFRRVPRRGLSEGEGGGREQAGGEDRGELHGSPFWGHDPSLNAPARRGADGPDVTLCVRAA